MTIGPRTEREQLIAEMAHAQGVQDGVRIVTQMLIERSREALKVIDVRQEVVQNKE